MIRSSPISGILPEDYDFVRVYKTQPVRKPVDMNDPRIIKIPDIPPMPEENQTNKDEKG